MFYSILILATAALTSAQNGSTGGYYSTSGPLEIDPNSVSPDLRQAWCRGQQNNCPKICGGPDAGLGAAYPNQCDPVSKRTSSISLTHEHDQCCECETAADMIN